MHNFLLDQPSIDVTLVNNDNASLLDLALEDSEKNFIMKIVRKLRLALKDSERTVSSEGKLHKYVLESFG